jgi:hypothetical protein
MCLFVLEDSRCSEWIPGQAARTCRVFVVCQVMGQLAILNCLSIDSTTGIRARLRSRRCVGWWSGRGGRSGCGRRSCSRCSRGGRSRCGRRSCSRCGRGSRSRCGRGSRSGCGRGGRPGCGRRSRSGCGRRSCSGCGRGGRPRFDGGGRSGCGHRGCDRVAVGIKGCVGIGRRFLVQSHQADDDHGRQVRILGRSHVDVGQPTGRGHPGS